MNNLRNNLRKTSLAHWAILAFLSLDILFVILHFAFGQQINYFNIDLEKNLPTLYQGFKLIVVAVAIGGILILNQIIYRGTRHRLLLLIPYWLGFIYLALDELGEIHENFGGFINQIGGDAVTNYREFFASLGFTSAQWLLFFLPLMVAAILYLFSLARYFKKQHESKVFIFILAIVCFALVPIIEFWNTSNTSYDYSFDARNKLIALEEYLEMLGASLFFAFNAILLRSKAQKLKALDRAVE